MVQQFWPQLVGLVFFVVWLVRLEAKGMNDRTKTVAEIKAVDTKVETHITNSKEKHDIVFDKLDKVENDVGDIKINVAKIAEHINKD